MEIRELKTTNERDGIKRPYLSPTTSVLALDYLEGVLAVLSWNDGHSEDNFATKEQDPEGDGKLSKSFNFQFEDIWADDTDDDDDK